MSMFFLLNKYVFYLVGKLLRTKFIDQQIGDLINFLDFLSAQTKELLRSMLTVNPKHRITIKELLVHPWLNKNYQQALKWNTIYDVGFMIENT